MTTISWLKMLVCKFSAHLWGEQQETEDRAATRMSDRATQPLLSGPYYQALSYQLAACQGRSRGLLQVKCVTISGMTLPGAHVQHSRPTSSEPTEHVQGGHVIQEVM